MPKRRSESSIANRSQETQDLSEQEMSERLQQRLEELGPIDVEIYSRSRHRNELARIVFTETGATVSTDGGAYHVNPDEETCTCPDHTHRGGCCRHIQAVGIARDEVRRGILSGSLNNDDVTIRQVATEAGREERREQLSISHEYTDDNFFYTEHPDAFQEDMERASFAAIPYEYENALNGSNTTFGIELEFVDGDSNAIARELYQLGICSNQSMGNYHTQRQPGKWIVERDGSVTSGNRGGEIISPILTDTPETWRQIEMVCEVAKRHGARVSHKTGGHVHVGAEASLDGKRQRWRRFFKLNAGFEEVYARISGGEQGRMRYGHYAQSSLSQNLLGIRARMPEEGTTGEFQGIISRISAGKYQMINISPFATKKTVEFRGFNGTLTPGVIQANVKYAVGLVNSAERSRIKGSETDNIIPSDSDRKRGRIINNYETNNTRTDTSIMAALDAIFPRQSDKKHLLSVIAKNDWKY